MVKSLAFFFVEQCTLAGLFTLKYIVYEANDRQRTLTPRRLNSPMSSPPPAFSIALSQAECAFEAQAAQLQIEN